MSDLDIGPKVYEISNWVQSGNDCDGKNMTTLQDLNFPSSPIFMILTRRINSYESSKAEVGKEILNKMHSAGVIHRDSTVQNVHKIDKMTKLIGIG